MTSQPGPRILLAEDSTPDAKLLMTLFEENGFQGRFTWCTDGEMVLKHLLQREADEELPQIILLDVGLPKINGHEILDRLKDDPSCSKIPVIMLSASSRITDYPGPTPGVNAVSRYYSKPMDLKGFEDLVTQLMREDFPSLGVS